MSWLLAAPAWAGTPPAAAGPGTHQGPAVEAGPAAGATPSLAQALNPDGTLRAGASGSFDARQYQMQTAPDGRPVFRPSGTMGIGDHRWAGNFGLQGANQSVAVVLCVGTSIYIAGSFTAVGDVAASNIAKWNGTAWSVLGSGPVNGTDARVYALAASPSGEVYVGGGFSRAGGLTVRQVAKWSGTAWSVLGTATDNGVYGEVTALAVSGSGDVYVGGLFGQTSGNVMANNIARWNGSAWSTLGTGSTNGVDDQVYALALTGSGQLYVGGRFQQAGGTAAKRVAQWNGSAWSTLGPGIGNTTNNVVYALAVSGSGEVYAGGDFGLAGGMAASSIARWNGTAWNSLGAGLGTGTNRTVVSLAFSGSGELYVGENYTPPGGGSVSQISRWNGTAWAVLGTGNAGSINNPAKALAFSGSGELFAGGDFTLAGGLRVNRIARWNGSAWSPMDTSGGNGVNGGVFAVAVAPTGEVYAGGRFTQAGALATNNIAKWNGTAWSSLGTGITWSTGFNNGVYALVVAPGGELYASGAFTHAGGVVVNNIAKWDGSNWSALGTGLVLANNTAPAVKALALTGTGELYAGGDFIQAGSQLANHVAKWNGTAWSTLGTGATNGVNREVRALAVTSLGELYVGGFFDQAGGQPARCIAKWNGTAWSTLGVAPNDGTNQPVCALAVSGSGDLYVGGYFNQVAGQFFPSVVAARSIAKWNGTTWSALGSASAQGTDGSVLCLAVSASGELYVGGTMTQAGGVPASNIAKWNGTAWSNLGTGLNGGVIALCVGPNNKVCVGGLFGGVGDGSKVSNNFAIWDPAAVSATAPALNAQVLLYPNPASKTVFVELPAMFSRAAYTAELVDALGHVVRTQALRVGLLSQQVSLQGLAAGVYSLRIATAQGTVSKKFVVE
ncbi:hypothetical protein GCM10023185_02050 [Hymenobacter saemangeumensis]|uniref:Secretion system C-terminal sorting domain-containing protein n=1 Tax=Hymenobacter saemangeumensis TaxID=1084522 RepID=A0ABP8HXX2_9BACT